MDANAATAIIGGSNTTNGGGSSGNTLTTSSLSVPSWLKHRLAQGSAYPMVDIVGGELGNDDHDSGAEVDGAVVAETKAVLAYVVNHMKGELFIEVMNFMGVCGPNLGERETRCMELLFDVAVESSDS